MVRGEAAIARATALKLYLSERIASEADTDIERGYLASLAPNLGLYAQTLENSVRQFAITFLGLI